MGKEDTARKVRSWRPKQTNDVIANSPEGALIVAVLLTFIHDMNRVNQCDRYERKRGRFNNWCKKHRQKLIREAEGDHTRDLCDLINFDHRALVNRLKVMAEKCAVIDLSDSTPTQYKHRKEPAYAV